MRLPFDIVDCIRDAGCTYPALEPTWLRSLIPRIPRTRLVHVEHEPYNRTHTHKQRERTHITAVIPRIPRTRLAHVEHEPYNRTHTHKQRERTHTLTYNRYNSSIPRIPCITQPLLLYSWNAQQGYGGYVISETDGFFGVQMPPKSSDD